LPLEQGRVKAPSPHDPFGERSESRYRARFGVLGSNMQFVSNHRGLLELAQQSFGRLPVRREADAVRLRVILRVVPGADSDRRPPPAPAFSSGAGLLFAHVDAQSFAVVAPAQGLALVQVSASLLRHRYHVRYELLEFAAIVLAVRARGMVSLHAACVGRGTRGVLLLGDSGAGKSTLTLACALDGSALLSEDGVFLDREDARLRGLPAFLHIATDALELVNDPQVRAELRRSPRIQRRSGARKLEIDARRNRLRLARAPLDLVSTIVLSPARAAGEDLLEPLNARALALALRRTQPYAARQPGWKELEGLLLRRGGYRLRRGRHPDDGARAVRALLRGERP
jgi:hypothetical protein